MSRAVPSYRHQKELVSQIDMLVCQILARGSQRDGQVKELLDIFTELQIWRGTPQIHDAIVDGLQHIALMSGLSAPRVAAFVPDKLWHALFIHLVGPEYVSINRADEKRMAKCIEALETLTTYNCEYGHGQQVMHEITRWAKNFLEGER
jgi:hypothetical protein